jgi:hypothetical protein
MKCVFYLQIKVVKKPNFKFEYKKRLEDTGF